MWKPWPIEDLWDSILRGFPVGSIIVHETPAGKLQLLNDQQRTTSIVLAFGGAALSSKVSPWSRIHKTDLLCRTIV